MKKAILLVVLGLLFAPVVKAQTEPTVPENVYFFGDGKGYDEDGTQKYLCFGIIFQSCYSIEGIFAFTRELQGIVSNLQNQISELRNTVSQIPISTENILPSTTSSPIPVPITPANETATSTPAAPEPVPYLVGASPVYNEKYRLIRDGQIVGYKKVGDEMRSWKLNGVVISTEKSGGKAELYSYENRNWFLSKFPYDSEQKFIKFDSNSLQEVYEGDVSDSTVYTEKYRLFNNQGQLMGFKKVNGNSVIYSFEDSIKGWNTLPLPTSSQFTYTTPKKFLQWDATNFVEIYEE